MEPAHCDRCLATPRYSATIDGVSCKLCKDCLKMYKGIYTSAEKLPKSRVKLDDIFKNDIHYYKVTHINKDQTKIRVKYLRSEGMTSSFRGEYYVNTVLPSLENTERRLTYDSRSKKWKSGQLGPPWFHIK